MPEKKKKLLLIDDDPSTLRIASAFLKREGYEVVTSSSPFVALLLEERKFDLIITDINMPEFTGDRLVEVLKKHGFPNIPVVFFSGQSKERVVDLAEESGVAGYVLKKQGLGDLLKKVKSVLKK